MPAELIEPSTARGSEGTVGNKETWLSPQSIVPMPRGLSHTPVLGWSHTELDWYDSPQLDWSFSKLLLKPQGITGRGLESVLNKNGSERPERRLSCFGVSGGLPGPCARAPCPSASAIGAHIPARDVHSEQSCLSTQEPASAGWSGNVSYSSD